jgi:hypothetical protein
VTISVVPKPEPDVFAVVNLFGFEADLAEPIGYSLAVNEDLDPAVA